jgi:hypothetical protein
MNSKDRPSISISAKQTAGVIDASIFAWSSGQPLTRFVTVNLKRVEIRPQQFISAYTKLAGDWIATKDAPRTYIAVIEKPSPGPLNVHFLFHVPEPLMEGFTRKQTGWARQIGIRIIKGTIQSKALGTKAGRAESLGERTISYMLKGADPSACRLLRIDHVHQGVVLGKRIAVAQSIGAKARDEGGYRMAPSERMAMMFPRRYRLEG